MKTKGRVSPGPRCRLIQFRGSKWALREGESRTAIDFRELPNPQPAHESSKAILLFEYRRRPTDSLAFYVDTYLDAIRYFYERDTTLHSIFFPIEGHGAF